MALTDTEKRNLDQLRRQLTQKTVTEPLRKETENIKMYGISIDDLKALVDPVATQGFDFTTLNLATLDTDTLNATVPGAINVRELKKKIANYTLRKGYVVDLIDTQSGVMQVQTEVKMNSDIEDVLTSKIISQGTNLQLINLAKSIRSELVANKDITSRFLED